MNTNVKQRNKKMAPFTKKVSSKYKKTKGSGAGNVVEVNTWLRGVVNFIIRCLDPTTGRVTEVTLTEQIVSDIQVLLEEETSKNSSACLGEPFFLGLHHKGCNYPNQPMVVTPEQWKQQLDQWDANNMYVEECKVAGHGKQQQIRFGNSMYSLKWFLVKLKDEPEVGIAEARLLPYALTGTMFPPSLMCYVQVKRMGPVKKYCLNCGKSNVKVCSGCREVGFCGKKCQKETWKYHKTECHRNDKK